ncbi:hypothetical protein IJL65_05805 [bacterium]|nr:hypothetical protein [bacterium]
MDVHIAKEEDGRILVKNDGDNVTVKTNADDTKETKLATTAELVSITKDSESINIIDDVDLMSAFMAKNNISATFTVSTDKVDWPTIQPKQPSDTLAMNTTGLDKKEDNLEVVTDVPVEPERDPLLDDIIGIMSSDSTVI